MHVFWAASGRAVASLDAEQVDGKSVKSLKAQLAQSILRFAESHLPTSNPTGSEIGFQSNILFGSTASCHPLDLLLQEEVGNEVLHFGFVLLPVIRRKPLYYNIIYIYVNFGSQQDLRMNHQDTRRTNAYEYAMMATSWLKAGHERTRRQEWKRCEDALGTLG